MVKVGCHINVQKLYLTYDTVAQVGKHLGKIWIRISHQKTTITNESSVLMENEEMKKQEENMVEFLGVCVCVCEGFKIHHRTLKYASLSIRN